MADTATAALAQKAAKGSRAAFDELCGIKTRKMLFIAYNILGDYHEAEDVVQEAILAMFMNIRKLRCAEAFDAWMSSIVRRKCSMRLKKRAAYGDLIDIDEYEIDIEDRDKEFLPEAYVEDDEMRKCLYEVIAGLPAKKRDAIIMYYYENLSYKEIARIMNSSIKTVGSNITRARAIIMDKLGQSKFAPGRLTASGSALVISRALEDQAMQIIPDQAVSAFQLKLAAVTQPLQFPVAQAVLSAKNIAVVSICSTLVTGGVVAVPAYIDSTRDSREAVAAADIHPEGEISFAGGSVGLEHVNPSSAVLTIEGVGPIASAPTWTIADKATGDVVASGDGYKVTDAFDKLKKKKRTGRYVLTFEAKGENGVAVKAHRAFEIIALAEISEAAPADVASTAPAVAEPPVSTAAPETAAAGAQEAAPPETTTPELPETEPEETEEQDYSTTESEEALPPEDVASPASISE